MKTNEHGGFYAAGKRYTRVVTIDTYHLSSRTLDELGMPPSIRQLCKRAKISFKTSQRTIQFIKDGMISFPKRGHAVKRK